MQTSESIDAIGGALAKAQLELQNPPKNKVNPHFNSKYVDLSDGLDVIRKVLGKHAIAVVQATKAEESTIILHTRLIHSSGQWIESTYPVSGLERHQVMGSALTYSRRYALFSMVGVAGEDDDDGNAAQEAKPVAGKTAKKQATPGLSPDESEKVFKSLSGILELAKSVDDLNQWAKDNQAVITTMLPAHQNQLRDKFKATREELMEDA